jgi:hypothetical protein
MTTRIDGTSSTTLATLINGLRAHLQGYPLPEPATVRLEPTIRRVSTQAGTGRNELDPLGELLLWVYTLDQVSAEWWHSSNGDLHITIGGRCVTGVLFRVYGGMPFGCCAGLVQLASGASEGVSLDALYTLLVLLRQHQESIKEVSS